MGAFIISSPHRTTAVSLFHLFLKNNNYKNNNYKNNNYKNNNYKKIFAAG
jgi:hypothetical protein